MTYYFDSRRISRPSHKALDILSAIILLSFFVFVGMTLCGCASSRFSEDLMDGDSYGFLRNHSAEKTTIAEEFNPDGTLKSRTTTTTRIGTESTTSDMLLGMNELLGTAIEGAEKAK